MNALESARRIVAEATGVAVDGISEDDDMFSLSGWDSIAHMKIILAIEAETGAHIEPEFVAGLTGVRDLVVLFEPDRQ